MIKLTNKEASDILSPLAMGLFSDSKRPFPNKDIFLLLDIVEVIEKRLKPYHKRFREIVHKYEGTILDSGHIIYEDPEKKKLAVNDLIELNETQLEYNFEPLKRKEDWPKLSLAEAKILKPLMRNGNNERHSG